MNRFFVFMSVLLLAAVAAGCQDTRYYQNRAVEKARDYLLDNAPELTPDEIAYVKFNKPALLVENIFASGNDLSQICITWLIPGRDNVYMVFGASEMRMATWSPNRLIRKVFPKANSPLLTSVAMAQNYAANNLFFDMSVHQYNTVRFSYPEIRQTTFQLEKKPAGKTQYSMIWDCGEPDTRVVVCGWADADAGNFSVSFGAILTAEELRSNMADVKPLQIKALPFNTR